MTFAAYLIIHYCEKSAYNQKLQVNEYELIFSCEIMPSTLGVCNILLLCILHRLVLLLQLMGMFVELSCSKSGISSGSSATSTSVGPIAKKYWSRMLHLCTLLTQMMSQV